MLGKPENVVLAREAGSTVALVPATDEDLPDILLLAGMTIRFGMSEADALRAITLDAAKVLGVDERVGSLEPAGRWPHQGQGLSHRACGPRRPLDDVELWRNLGG